VAAVDYVVNANDDFALHVAIVGVIVAANGDFAVPVQVAVVYVIVGAHEELQFL
jgi:hypothetical protein